MYYDIVNFMGSIYKISESYGQGKKRSFEVVFKKLHVKLVVFVQSFSLRSLLQTCPYSVDA